MKPKRPLPAGIRVRDDGKYIAFWCPGCKSIHGWIPITPGGAHAWTWDPKRHTLAPSVRHFSTHPKTQQQMTTCHYHVKKGRIEFCMDSPHALAGQTLPLDQTPPADYGGRESFGWVD